MVEEIKVYPIFEYPFCCVCFDELTDKNIVVRKSGKWNVCKECENKVSWEHDE